MLVTKHLRDIKPISQCSKILTDVFFTRKLFKTNIVVPTYTNHSNSDIWYIVTNDDPHRATKIILIVLVLLNAFLNRKNQMVLD